MPSFNQVIMLGHLTQNPELQYLSSGTAISKFGIATNHKWKDASGKEREEVCFIDCTAFGKQAENINKYCARGNPLLVAGMLKFEQWVGQDGNKKSKHVINVQKFQLIGSAKQSGNGTGAVQDRSDPIDSGVQNTNIDYSVDQDLPF